MEDIAVKFYIAQLKVVALVIGHVHMVFFSKINGAITHDVRTVFGLVCHANSPCGRRYIICVHTPTHKILYQVSRTTFLSIVYVKIKLLYIAILQSDVVS